LENVSNSLTNYATTAFATNSAWQAATQLESTLPPTLFASTASANNSYSLMSVPTHFPVLYATAGHNLSLYNLGFLWPGGLAPAYAQWNTLLGTNYSRCWLNTFGNTNAATNSLSWVVASGDITLLTLPLSLVVSSNTAGAGVTRKVLIVGDSTTADGQPTRDLLNLFKNDTMAITLLGTVNSGGGTNRHEGHPGWAYSTFDRSTNSPFVFSGAFDFRTYLGTNGWTLATNDWVIFNLGINDIYTCASDASAGASSATAFGDASNMIANIESVVPGIRVGVCLTIPPSADADSFAQRIALYGVGRDRYVRNRAIFNSYLLANYKSWGTNVFVIPLSAALDDIYDFTTALQPESLDITNLVLRGTDGIHPNAIGYQQVANMYFHFLKGNEK
jgi:lysophospholipase L1-like esterase